ncbi:hypothetical protein B0H13DRAFT_2335153 [Mycena leptocephala]|nr:hypothetical protein B0H13DRAFT_2335153 [Mycena leptocephala]
MSNPGPYVKKRRTIIACSHCRKRKMKCITTEQPPKNPCAYCAKKRLHCEYVVNGDSTSSCTDSSSPPSPNSSRGHAAPRDSTTGTPAPNQIPDYLTPPAFGSEQQRLPARRLSTVIPRISRGYRGENSNSPIPEPFVFYPFAPAESQHSRDPSCAATGPTQVYDLQAAQARQYLANCARANCERTLLLDPSAPQPSAIDAYLLPAFSDTDTHLPNLDWPPSSNLPRY